MSETSRGRTKRVIAPRGRGGRRSQIERDQLSQAERERNRERDEQYQKEQNAARLLAERAERDRRHREEKAARARNRGRGGFMGETRTLSSGPLGAGSTIDPNDATGKAYPRPRVSSNKRASARERSTASVLGEALSESGIKKEPARPSIAYDFQFSDAVKDDAIDGGYISSDIDEPNQGIRKPIEEINLISDEDEEISRTINMPIHLKRNRHTERATPVNPNAPDAAVIKAEDDDVHMTDAPSAYRKGKSRAKDIELVEERIWKGVWADPTDSIIKRENDIEILPDNANEPQTGRTQSKSKDIESEAKLKRARRTTSTIPKLYTEEERKEYTRQLEDDQILLSEFAKNGASRDNHTYIFQFPPIVPNLAPQKPIVIKDDPDEPTQSVPPSVNLTSNRDTPIKIEEDSNDQQATRPRYLPTLAPGAVGKLQVHKSGKVTMNWGGLPFVVQNGVNPNFLQDLVMVRTEQSKTGANSPRLVPRDPVGDAAAFGQPRGKLVLTPDFDHLLDKAK